MSEHERYQDPLFIEFKMPSVRLVSMEPDKQKLDAIQNKWLRRILSWALATRKRKFVLENDFQVTVDKFSDDRLNGVLTVPSTYANQKIVFDGASIPLPWLAAALSFDVLRPLGAVLIPSIVHDYLFEQGNIKVEKEVQPASVTVERDVADQLFLEMFRTVSGMRLWPWVAWVAVRTGAPVVRYNGKRGGINRVLISVFLALIPLFWFLSQLAPMVFWVLLVLLPGITALDWLVERITLPYQGTDNQP